MSIKKESVIKYKLQLNFKKTQKNLVIKPNGLEI